MDVVLKTSINTRAPLHERVPTNTFRGNVTSVPTSATQEFQDNVQEINTFAMASHRVPVTTYDTDYTPKVLNEGDNNNKSKESTKMIMMSKDDDDDDDDYKDKQVTVLESTLQETADSENNMKVSSSSSSSSSAADQTRDVVITHYPSSQWESESHAASRVVQPVQCLDFYARARQVEQVDDDKRGALVGNVQRSLEIRNKRANDPVLRPPHPTYQHAERAHLSSLVAREKFGTPVNYLDLVQCKHHNGMSEYIYGFHDTPMERLHEYTPHLSFDVPTQRKALTNMSTSHELFAGTCKSTRNKPPGYGGYVPHTSANMAAMQNNNLDVDYAVLSAMPANTHKSEHNSNMDSRISSSSSSLPPHMGITMTDLNDPRRNYSKAIMTLAVHGGGVDPSIAPNALKSRHRTGKYARAPQMLKPKTVDSINQTVEGRMLQCAIHDVTREEQALNVRDDKRSSAYF